MEPESRSAQRKLVAKYGKVVRYRAAKIVETTGVPFAQALEQAAQIVRAENHTKSRKQSPKPKKKLQIVYTHKGRVLFGGVASGGLPSLGKKK